GTKKMKPNFTTGTDSIPAFFVKDTISCLLHPLHIIYNLIIQTGSYPKMWKTTKILTVFKSGNRNCVQNYRAVAIACNFAKVFESLLAKCLYSHVSESLNDNQHGFVRGRSTVTNLC